jgi:hypothetical protein
MRPSLIQTFSSASLDDTESPVERLSRVAHYIYQRVIRRKAVPFQPSPKNSEHILYFVKEELECGHTVEVYPDGVETFTARKRNCHECSSWFGGLKLPAGKKPNASILRSYERIKKQAGESQWWALIFGGACLGLLALIVFTHLPKLYVYQYPADTFQIVQKIDPFHYKMRRVHAGLDSFSREFTTTFCSNYPLAFSAGETLIWLAYEDKGCWDVSGKELGYLFLRDDKGNVILAPNCYWKDDVLAECKGVPRWEEK